MGVSPCHSAGMRRMVRKHDCALPTLHPKYSNARGAFIRVRVRVTIWVRVGVQVGLHCRLRVSDTPISSEIDNVQFSLHKGLTARNPTKLGFTRISPIVQT